MAEKKITAKVSKGTKEPKETKVSSPVIASKAKQSSLTKKSSMNSSSSRTGKVESSLKISVIDTEGKAAGSMTLPEAIFGAKVNPTLMAQAVRVYLANQRQGNASTKTRGEVNLTTAKWYRQKGTGRARHGAKSAPIFVKGGVAHGPKLRDFSLSLPSKMKRAALFSALSSQVQQSNVIVVSGLEKVGPKTKNMAQALTKIGSGKKALVVMPSLLEDVYKAGRNIKGITLTSASQLSTYSVLGAGKIIVMKEAIETLEKTFIK